MAMHVRELTDGERAKIECLARSQTAPVRLSRRAKIVQQSAAGRTVPTIARELGVCERIIRVWLRRFGKRGLDGLEDEPRRGRLPTYS